MLLIAVHLGPGSGGEKVMSLYMGVGMEMTSFRAVKACSLENGEAVVTLTWSPWSNTAFAGDKSWTEPGGRSLAAILIATDCVPRFGFDQLAINL